MGQCTSRMLTSVERRSRPDGVVQIFAQMAAVRSSSVFFILVGFAPSSNHPLGRFRNEAEWVMLRSENAFLILFVVS